jgi:endo-alpha-1,4-polygalactosaminidase (GH114 family)
LLIVPQNAEELLDDAAYRAVIDGIAKEDLLFGDGRSKHSNPQEVIEARSVTSRR